MSSWPPLYSHSAVIVLPEVKNPKQLEKRLLQMLKKSTINCNSNTTRTLRLIELLKHEDNQSKLRPEMTSKWLLNGPRQPRLRVRTTRRPAEPAPAWIRRTYGPVKQNSPRNASKTYNTGVTDHAYPVSASVIGTRMLHENKRIMTETRPVDSDEVVIYGFFLSNLHLALPARTSAMEQSVHCILDQSFCRNYNNLKY